MAEPRVGQKAVLHGKTVMWAGDNYGYQSPDTFKKLEQQGKLRFGAQAIDRAVSSVATSPIAKGIGQFQKDFKTATAFLDPVLGVVESGLNASSDLPSSRVGQGSAAVTNKLAEYLNVDPRIAAPAMLLGSLRFSTDRQLLAQQHQAAQLAKATRDRVTAAQQAHLNKLNNVPQQAKGPALKQFGAHNISEQQALADGLVTGGGGSTQGGRPSAAQSSPHLREVREGVRKSTGLQRQRDELNAHRQGGSPEPSRVQQYLPVGPERSAMLTAALQRQQQQAAKPNPRSITDARASNYNTPEPPSMKAREGLLRDNRPNPEPIRYDSLGNRIQPKAERATKVTPPPATRPNRPLNYSGSKPQRITPEQVQVWEAKLKRDKKLPPVDVRGTLGGEIKTTGSTPQPQRSAAQQTKARRVLNAAIQRIKDSGPSGDLDKLNTLVDLLKKVK